MELEVSTLALKYASLRVLDPQRVATLVADLSRHPQRSPVLVVGDGVLVDGYHRVTAIKALGRDVVAALHLDVSEAEALILAWRLQTGRRKCPLEEGWLLCELALAHGRNQASLAAEFRRTRSWVSQRLGLVRVLPDEVQEAVRATTVPAQAAMKSLLPLARIDPDACRRMVVASPEGFTVRQWAQICVAWRNADAEVRKRIEENPGLLIKTEEVLSPVPVDAEEKLLRGLEGIAGLCRRARQQMREGVFARANTPVFSAWVQAREAFASLEKEVGRAQS